MSSAYKYFLATVIVLAVTGVILHLMGRVPICTCGTIKLWQSEVWSSENSQHFADWYSFSHISHGFILYGLLTWLFPKTSVWKRFLGVLFIETSWEIVENTPWVINHYRETTISLDYYGDSILNSLADIVMCVLGIWLARKLPIWGLVALFVVMELGVLYAIRDNLSLNVLMLFFPIEAIKTWQMGKI